MAIAIIEGLEFIDISMDDVGLLDGLVMGQLSKKPVEAPLVGNPGEGIFQDFLRQGPAFFFNAGDVQGLTG